MGKFKKVSVIWNKAPRSDTNPVLPSEPPPWNPWASPSPRLCVSRSCWKREMIPFADLQPFEDDMTQCGDFVDLKSTWKQGVCRNGVSVRRRQRCLRHEDHPQVGDAGMCLWVLQPAHTPWALRRAPVSADAHLECLRSCHRQ